MELGSFQISNLIFQRPSIGMKNWSLPRFLARPFIFILKILIAGDYSNNLPYLFDDFLCPSLFFQLFSAVQSNWFTIDALSNLEKQTTVAAHLRAAALM